MSDNYYTTFSLADVLHGDDYEAVESLIDYIDHDEHGRGTPVEELQGVADRILSRVEVELEDDFRDALYSFMRGVEKSVTEHIDQLVANEGAEDWD